MLGDAICSTFGHAGCIVFPTDIVLPDPALLCWVGKLDVRDRKEMIEAARQHKPDVIIHLAALTDLEYCEQHPDEAMDTNFTGTLNAMLAAEAVGAVLVYVSTAGVFDGEKTGMYTESDEPHPVNVYGRTKLLGESAAKLGDKVYIVRAGWMMGGQESRDKKFVSKILRQVKQKVRAIHALSDHYGTPTYTYDFAKNLMHLLAWGEPGLYHMVNEGVASRADVAKHILKEIGNDYIDVVGVQEDFFSDSYPVKRPKNECLVNTNLERIWMNHMRPWREALSEYLKLWRMTWKGDGSGSM